MFELKTIAFEFDTMKRLIDYGNPIIVNGEFKGFDRNANPASLSMGFWLEFVPFEFKNIANRAINDIHGKFMYTKADEQTRLAIISHMLSFIRREMHEPRFIKDQSKYD